MRVIILLVAVIVLLAGCSSAAKHYRSHGDGSSLYQVLHDDIRNGQSLEEVRSYIGTGYIPCDQERQHDIYLKILIKRPAMLPNGVEDTDLFVVWQYDGSTQEVLQFRNNQLVNHDPMHFEEYRPFQSVR